MQIINKNECTGCTSCKNICPNNAITMIEDKDGFKYPKINKKKCTNCGLCRKKCPIFDKNYDKIKNEHICIYGCKHKEDNVRQQSSSGGMFTAISNYILKQKGIIYGAILDDEKKVRHIRATTIEERNKLRGSKYVQSELENTFQLIKNDLKKGEVVLFVGTPCQNAGLKIYLGKEYEKLLQCDFVCHGVPSPLLWEEFKNFLEKKNNSVIRNFKFRDKINGWHTHTESVEFDDGRIDNNSKISQANKYMLMSDLSYRKSCYECKFSTIKRVSDITISDYWGIEKKFPNFDDNKGVSLAIINTDKGKKCFENIKEEIEYLETSVDSCLQPQLIRPVKQPKKNNKFWEDYHNKGYEYVLKKYTIYGWKNRVNENIRIGTTKAVLKIIPSNIKQEIKRILHK